ncbi:MAG: 1-aminocyclopropane-1-carboxylate deaminase/D-cysteine desulfhydrase [Proteobacteria bacterium]|nr:1-aminocyclopropane-1-carboxylate deaminase/D-cysteine desulfhydrase [Pseudomonadota bacterium]NOG59999.1 1-aminocyclopropane-1-carboxylate deaminase/D-cysteine desulfhydrase [Pseudomonadota bacterium]
MVDITEIESRLGINIKAAILEPIQHPVLEERGIELHIKRDDLLHPVISGNKWRKLKYTLLSAMNNNHQHLISMGGTYSNHLHALAYVGNKLNIKTTGLIRGEPPEKENQTLTDLGKWGMTLEFVSRSAFRELRKHRTHNAKLEKQYGGFWIPEGGATQDALRGVGEILDEINIDFDTLTLGCGTGTTLAGLAKVLPDKKRVLGFSSLKGGGFLEKDVKKLIKKNSLTNWSINFDYHFGGFAKISEELISFINEFQTHTNIPLEPIYNGKMLFGLFDLVKNDRFKKGHKLIAIHTGGLQGNRQ